MSHRRRIVHQLVTVVLTVVVLHSTCAGAAPRPSTSDSAIALDPFEVKSAPDNSYGALNSNSITQFNAELQTLPISADIFTQTFMDDVGATTVEEMIRTYSAGAGLAQFQTGANGVGNGPGDRDTDFISLRGLQTPVVRRDGFLYMSSYDGASSTGPGVTANFDLERAEVIEGPQALLFGASGAGGAVNLVSKQAIFGKPAFGSVTLAGDQYGGKRAQFDYGASPSRNFAFRFAGIDQKKAYNRVNIGGPLLGLYGQFALRLFNNTTIQLVGEQTHYINYVPTYPTFTALNAANDARTTQPLRYLLASNQIAAAANGAASGAGVIANGLLNWGNVDSFSAARERVIDTMTYLTAHTVWNDWLSTDFDVGYKDFRDNQMTHSGVQLLAPNQATNPYPGHWTISNGALSDEDFDFPARTKAIRFAAMADKDLLGGRVHNKTIVGADFSRTDSAFIAYNYYQADANWNAVVNPAVATNQGRTQRPTQFYAIDNGLVPYPMGFAPLASRVTVGGINYIRMPQNPVNPARISPFNPEGVTLGGGSYVQLHTLNSGYYAMDEMKSFGGRLETIAGMRLTNYFMHMGYQGAAAVASASSGTGNASRFVIDRLKPSFEFGLNYALTSWLRPYVAVSDAYSPPITLKGDPYGNSLNPSKGLGEEVGLKFKNSSNTISGALALYNAKSSNELTTTSATVERDINPAGLNGFYGPANVFVGVDRKTQGAQLTVTAAPTSHWRLRVSAAAVIEAKVTRGQSYNLLYNDQFHANTAGQVTYADNTVVYVPPAFNSAKPTTTSDQPGAIPLTIAMMSDPKSPYYAQPLPVSGAINTASSAAKVLQVVDPAHGAILTGATGLPISQMQINPGFTPPSTLETNVAGDDLTGMPFYSFVATNVYTIPSGFLKGVRVGGTVNLAWKIPKFYYYLNGTGPTGTAPRSLYYLPNVADFDGILGYSHRFERFTFSTQVNVNNMFNHYRVLIIPNAVTSYTGVLNATFNTQPRSYIWTSTISF